MARIRTIKPEFWGDPEDKPWWRPYNDETVLYRLFDVNGSLLYVGISRNPAARLASHASRKSWWVEVENYILEWHPSRDEALVAERQVIQHEEPRYNIMCAPVDPRCA